MPILLACLSWVVAAATPSTAAAPDAGAILDRVSQVYQSMTSYRFEGTISMAIKAEGHDQSMEMPFVLAAARSGRVRTELSNPAVGIVSVSDGQQTWLYFPQLGQYTHTLAAPIAERDGRSGTVRAMTAGTPLSRYVDLKQGLQGSRLVREEAIRVGGATVNCYVIEADYQPPPGVSSEHAPRTYWVDKQRNLVVRDDTSIHLDAASGSGPADLHQVTRFKSARVNETVPDTVFTFRPPADAQQVDQLALPGMKPPQLEGQPARVFTLPSLAGKPQGPATWRGKVVLLDFWASWCGPCRKELPVLVKLQRELQPKGLVVVGVNVGESAETVSRFAQQSGLAFTVLLDASGEVADGYAVSGLPTTLVIDPQGQIVSYLAGLTSEQELRTALKLAGLK